TGKRLLRFGVRKLPYLLLAFAPDGKALATQDLTGAVRLWDTATGKELRRITQSKVDFPGPLKGGQQTIRGLGFTFSPDGKLLAARGPDRAIRLWETATAKEVRKLAADPEDACPIAFSRDGRTLATCSDQLIRLWDVASGKVVARLEGHKELAG